MADQQQFTGKTLHWIVAVILIVAGIAKVFQLSMLVQMFDQWGLGGLTLWFGIIEVVVGALLLIPSMLMWGVLLSTAWFGGAMAVHLTHGQTGLMFVPLVVMLGVWGGLYLREPKLWQ